LRPKLISSGGLHIQFLDQLRMQRHARQSNGNAWLFSPNYLLDS
jgi:hypothetical protein